MNIDELLESPTVMYFLLCQVKQKKLLEAFVDKWPSVQTR